MEEQLRKIRECIATMMDVLPNPAIAVVTVKDEKKSKKMKKVITELKDENI